ncbi:MAG TPA: beta-ketoacyl synthase chain length factor [Phycisphaerae bacterium]|nr:beta-ketoacyl synthase chain length factor [Phycisphaerae bacterium]
MPMRLDIHGVGLVTDRYGSVHEVAGSAGGEPGDLLRCATVLEESAVASHDVLAQLAIRAIHQAHSMARLEEISGEEIGLLFQTSWGMIDSTVAYLESMLAENGKYASPRHFSRSVYSSAASLAAIHFGIHGPCETLTFEREILSGPLRQAGRMLAARRCERVIVVWAEQASEVAGDLAVRAARQLHRREYEPYVRGGVGYGAIAAVVGLEGGIGSVEIGELAMLDFAAIGEGEGKPFAMEAAMGLVRRVLGGT